MKRSVLRWAPVALLVAGAAACSDSTTSPVTVVGSTPGWMGGNTVTFDYTQQFSCANPPSSGAPSKCELGADAQSSPASGAAPVLYVMTPLGFTPSAGTLHCPTPGNCVTHPSTIDLSRVFGAGTESATTPAHSHIIDTAAPTPRAFLIKVIGVKDQPTWDQVVAGKSLTTVRSLQAGDAGGTHITGDIPTNLFLFFRTR